MDDNKKTYFSLGASVLTHGLLLVPFIWATTPHPRPLLAPPIELRLQQESTPDRGSTLAQALGEILQSTTLKPLARTVSSAPSGTALEDYLLRWQQKIETIGNQYYLASKDRRRHQGDLRVLVSLYKDGRVKTCEIRHSSGDKALELIVQNIIKQAGPFGPLPRELDPVLDELEIIKTWSFKGDFGLKEH